MHAWVLQLHLRKGRQGKVAVDLIVGAEHRADGIGMAKPGREGIELVAVGLAELARRGDLEHHSLDRDFERRNRDPVLVGEIRERFHVRIAGDEQHGRTARGREALDLALRAVPCRQKVCSAAGRHIDVARDERLHGGAAAGQADPVHRHVAQSRGGRVLLDQLVLPREDQRHVGQAGLIGDQNLLDLRDSGAARPNESSSAPAA